MQLDRTLTFVLSPFVFNVLPAPATDNSQRTRKKKKAERERITSFVVSHSSPPLSLTLRFIQSLPFVHLCGGLVKLLHALGAIVVPGDGEGNPLGHLHSERAEDTAEGVEALGELGAVGGHQTEARFSVGDGDAVIELDEEVVGGGRLGGLSGEDEGVADVVKEALEGHDALVVRGVEVIDALCDEVLESSPGVEDGRVVPAGEDAVNGRLKLEACLDDGTGVLGKVHVEHEGSDSDIAKLGKLSGKLTDLDAELSSEASIALAKDSLGELLESRTDGSVLTHALQLDGHTANVNNGEGALLVGEEADGKVSLEGACLGKVSPEVPGSLHLGEAVLGADGFVDSVSLLSSKVGDLKVDVSELSQITKLEAVHQAVGHGGKECGASNELHSV
mmetsp:Transcript_36640/g.72046  ORF Transcript_36640/g.72046 Transcript_36640/m.72046 type:complete len:391 (-) Transcript_36640:115-1287(-)